MTIEESRRDKIALQCLKLFAWIGCTLAAMIPLAGHTNLFGELRGKVLLGCFVGIFLAAIGVLATTLFTKRYRRLGGSHERHR